MSSAPNDGSQDVFDQFLSTRGHDTGSVSWERSHNKKQCPECGGLHETSATDCTVCGWSP